jgi:mono/diheme cytochrome c family protein
MYRNTSTSILITFFLLFNFSTSAQDGENIFKTTCAACHLISNNRLVGPGLANVHERRTQEWFNKFVTSSQTLIKSGDVDAVKLFEEYNNIVMPDQAFSDAELTALYEYIKSESLANSNVAETQNTVEKEVPFEPTEEDIIIGQNLFSGKQRFVNGGPSCISCHNVRYDSIISGGGLALDLTETYKRLGENGVKSMINGLPFPQMKSSYQNHQITEKETAQLVSFLYSVSQQPEYPAGTSYRNMLLIWGAVGAAVLMGIIPLIWYKRKKDSVNKRIYERQIKSSN